MMICRGVKLGLGLGLVIGTECCNRSGRVGVGVRVRVSRTYLGSDVVEEL